MEILFLLLVLLNLGFTAMLAGLGSLVGRPRLARR